MDTYSFAALVVSIISVYCSFYSPGVSPGVGVIISGALSLLYPGVYNYSGGTISMGFDSGTGVGVGAGVCIFSCASAGLVFASGFSFSVTFGVGVGSLIGAGYYFGVSFFVSFWF